MGAIKVTFSLDEDTVSKLEETAGRLRRPKSAVVREAIQDYAARSDRLGEAERLRMLQALDQLLELIPERPAEDVDRELAELRQARRSGGRRRAPP